MAERGMIGGMERGRAIVLDNEFGCVVCLDLLGLRIKERRERVVVVGRGGRGWSR